MNPSGDGSVADDVSRCWSANVSQSRRPSKPMMVGASVTIAARACRGTGSPSTDALLRRSQALRRLCQRRLDVAAAHQSEHRRRYSLPRSSLRSCSSRASELSVDSGCGEDDIDQSCSWQASVATIDRLPLLANDVQRRRCLGSWSSVTAWSTDETANWETAGHSWSGLDGGSLQHMNEDGDRDKQTQILRAVQWIHGQLKKLQQHDLDLVLQLVQGLRTLHRLREDIELERKALQKSDEEGACACYQLEHLSTTLEVERTTDDS